MFVRIVLDTNVLVSGLLSAKGPPGQILRAVRSRKLSLITCPHQINELRDVLRRPHLEPWIRQDEAEDLMLHLENVARVIHDAHPVDLSPDPDDNPILAAALAGKAECIVSGDKSHMIDLKEVMGIPIRTPRQYVIDYPGIV